MQDGDRFCPECGKQSEPMVQNKANWGNTDEVVSTGEWVWSIILAAIPLVGMIFLLLTAFDKGTNLSKRNWARAQLIFALIGVVLFILGFASMLLFAGQVVAHSYMI